MDSIVTEHSALQVSELAASVCACVYMCLGKLFLRNYVKYE